MINDQFYIGLIFGEAEGYSINLISLEKFSDKAKNHQKVKEYLLCLLFTSKLLGCDLCASKEVCCPRTYNNYLHLS